MRARPQTPVGDLSGVELTYNTYESINLPAFGICSANTHMLQACGTNLWNTAANTIPLSSSSRVPKSAEPTTLFLRFFIVVAGFDCCDASCARCSCPCLLGALLVPLLLRCCLLVATDKISRALRGWSAVSKRRRHHRGDGTWYD